MPNKLFEMSFADIPIISNKLDEIEEFLAGFLAECHAGVGALGVVFEFELQVGFEVFGAGAEAGEGEGPEVDAGEEIVAAAREEMSHYGEFDYVIVNDVFEEAVAQMHAIFTASRLRREAQDVRHAGLIAALLAD
mgnify:CR=1 FL=1